MAKSEEQQRLLLRRIKSSSDGPDFLAYLRDLSADNYDAFKESGPEMNDIHKGYALAVDKLLDSFTECDNEPETKDTDIKANAHY